MRGQIVRELGNDGAVKLPRSMREALKISDGGALLLQVEGKGDIILRKPPRLKPHK